MVTYALSLDKMKSVNFRILLVTISVFSINCVVGIPNSLNGRPVSGMLRPPYAPPNVEFPNEQFFEFQKLNHFDGSDIRYWKQRYFVNNAFHKDGGPIFLMLGGEAEAEPVWMITGAWLDYAREHGAMMVMLEHRYYGQSRPVANLTTPNLQYLSSQQALADISEFIDYFRQWERPGQHYNNTIIFGGGYAGSLAAWFRSRYPWQVDGAVTSSAPMVAVMEFSEYYVAVADALDTSDPKCRVEINNATQTLDSWWGQPEKRVLMQNIFRLCDKINHDALLDFSVLFYKLALNFADVAQYNKVNLHQDDPGRRITIDLVCDIMTDMNRGNSVQRYADVNSLIMDTYKEQCLDIRYTSLAASLNHTDWSGLSADGRRQWLYQTCSEFGWFLTSQSYKQPFGMYFTFPFNFTTDQCIDVFQREFGGSEVQNNCDETNRFYGGLQLPVSKVLFVNGDMDPWRNVTIHNTLPKYPDNTVLQIPGAAHCADLYPASANDSPELVSARSIISVTLGKWLAGR